MTAKILKAGVYAPAFFYILLSGKVNDMNYALVAFEKTILVDRIAQELNVDPILPQRTVFADGELNVTLQDSGAIDGKTVLLVHSTGTPVNENILSVAFLAQELKNAGAKKVIAVVPYFGYARQERSKIAGKHGHAQIVAQLFEQSGIDELFAVELHDEKILEFFSIPVHNISVSPVMVLDIEQRLSHRGSSFCLVAPDEGAREFVDAIAHCLNVPSMVFIKERYAADRTRIIGNDGTCSGSTAIIIDDILATGGTAVQVCDAVHAMGFKEVVGYFTHPVFAGNAAQKIKGSHFTKIVVGNTLPLPQPIPGGPSIESFDVSEAVLDALRKYIFSAETYVHNDIKVADVLNSRPL